MGRKPRHGVVISRDAAYYFLRTSWAYWAQEKLVSVVIPSYSIEERNRFEEELKLAMDEAE